MSVPVSYPDWLGNLVEEACEDFVDGKYISCLLTASLSVEWVLISEAAPRRIRGLLQGIDHARDMGLPVEKPFDEAEETQRPSEAIL